MVRRVRREISRVVRVARFESRDRFANKVRPVKPRVINMMANDICNSHCVMCNIWQQKRDYEMSPAELRQVLSDPLFEKVRGVGITGGEPTLRPDLPDLFEACIESLPALRNLSTITNAIREEQVVDRIERCGDVAQQHGKSFSVMVSLDGYGEVHDAHRGTPGNFASATNVIEHFSNRNDVSVQVGCTITNQNVWHVDELLDWMIDRGVYGRFRVAEFIDRLYNHDLGSHIRNFSDDEVYHLTGFFKKLELFYETNEAFRDTYRSIQGMLQGEPRSSSCPYQVDGVVLGSTGNLLYCAPKSKPLGDARNSSALALYKEQLGERKRIREEHCSDCIHDYHAPPRAKAQASRYGEMAWRLALRQPISPVAPLARMVKRRPAQQRHVVITGWYGTETVGDKAILAEIVEQYRAQYGADIALTITSIHPFVTERTMRELGIDAEVVRAYSAEFLRACASADEIVVGGGPIMGIADLGLLLSAFRIGKRRGARRVVYGCGMGPLDDPRYERMARRLLLLADDISLRDMASVSWAERLTGRRDVTRVPEPAHSYLTRHFPPGLALNATPTQGGTLACFLRSWPTEYRSGRSDDDFRRLRASFEERLARSIGELCRRTGWTPVFYSMHTFAVGGDDRDFNRRFVREYDLESFGARIELQPSSVAQIVDGMRQADHNICMRFHSVVFADALGRPFSAFDYTNGVKRRSSLPLSSRKPLIFPPLV